MHGEATQYVRDLAEERGVSERTVWRWFAAMNAADSIELLDQPGDCRCCGEPLPEQATIRRRYCDDICRQYARRGRLARATHAATRRS